MGVGVGRFVEQARIHDAVLGEVVDDVGDESDLVGAKEGAFCCVLKVAGGLMIGDWVRVFPFTLQLFATR